MKLVTPEQAKLLKEKGFKSLSNNYYESDGELIESPHTNNSMQRFRYEAPKQHEVVEWLYENHGIWIYVSQNSTRLGFRWYAQRLNVLGESNYCDDNKYDYPQEAYSAAFVFILNNNLI